MSQGDVIYRPPEVESHQCKPPMQCAVYRTHPNEPSDDCWAPVFDHWQPCPGWHESEKTPGLKYGCVNGQATEPIGSVWRCDCGRYWTVYVQENHPNSRMFVAYQPEWRASTWLERRRARRQARNV